METKADSNSSTGCYGDGDDDEEIASIKKMRQYIETRIESVHKEHEGVMSSMQTLVPLDVFSSVNLSLRLLSSFRRRPFSPLPPPPLHPTAPRRPLLKYRNYRARVFPQTTTAATMSTSTPVEDALPTSVHIDSSPAEENTIKDLEAMLSKKSFKELEKSKTTDELLALIGRPTVREIQEASKFKTKGGHHLKEYCLSLTKDDCRWRSRSCTPCDKVHFRRIIELHTDVSLGDCSFLDAFHRKKTCKFVHYELDCPFLDVSPWMANNQQQQRLEYCTELELGESQWINCDIRSFRMDILGQFGVIMADPPWDIHMELPYGTMPDVEMLALNVPALQTDGLIFLWVTGRAMELGRECLDRWGYERVEEIIWVKTNQLQRIVRTGRTGHWLNHSKEHCLVGIKGNPIVNKNIDTDVIVSEVRETSRKPDEMYALLERVCPRTRKLELFARVHNTHAGWLSLGNPLNGTRLVDQGLRARFKAAYPDVEVQPPSPSKTSAMEIASSAENVYLAIFR